MPNVVAMRARSDFRPARRKAPDEATLRELAALRGAPQPPASPSSSTSPQHPAQPAGVLRWIFDITKWQPSKAEWAFLLTQLPEVDSTKVMRFLKEDDRKRAIISRLLQRRACHEMTGLPWAAINIERTKGGKPFMANKPSASAAGMLVPSNWNFNVSHEGMYVVLAAEPLTVVGIDVAAPFDVRPGKKETIDDHLRVFHDQFTDAEKREVERWRPDEAKMERTMMMFWSLKEAYTKGRGDGLGFEFNRCDFSVGDVEKGSDGQPVQHATVSVDRSAVTKATWRFFMQPTATAGHWISVARGKPTDVVDANGAFKATFREALDKARLRDELARPEPPFVTKRIDELVPDEARETLRTKAREP